MLLPYRVMPLITLFIIFDDTCHYARYASYDVSADAMLLFMLL